MSHQLINDWVDSKKEVIAVPLHSQNINPAIPEYQIIPTISVGDASENAGTAAWWARIACKQITKWNLFKIILKQAHLIDSTQQSAPKRIENFGWLKNLSTNAYTNLRKWSRERKSWHSSQRNGCISERADFKIGLKIKSNSAHVRFFLKKMNMRLVKYHGDDTEENVLYKIV